MMLGLRSERFSSVGVKVFPWAISSVGRGASGGFTELSREGASNVHGGTIDEDSGGKG